MSVAFRRESDDEHLEPKFELPVPPGPNFVTLAGLAQIEARVAQLEAALDAAEDEDKIKSIRRDLRYWRGRQSTAQIAPPPRESEVGIGSRVTLKLREQVQTITITGYDEADPAKGLIAFSAPLARAILGTSAGDVADFAGEADAVEIMDVAAA